MKTINFIFQLFLIGLLLCLPAMAEPVSINRGIGLGFVFKHRGNCYLILPDHVRQGLTRLSLATAAPSAIGDAEIFRSYAPDVDLAVGIVTSGLSERCTDRFDTLRTDLQPLLDSANTAQLVRVDAGGLEMRDDMVITSFDFESITARVDVTSAAEIYQGSSGGILRVGNAIIGMAIQSPGIEEAFFLRADEIAARLGRLLDTGPTTFTAQLPLVATTAALRCPAGTIAIASIQCNLEPPTPDLACSNLLAGGAAAFPPSQVAPRLVLDLPGDAAMPVGMITLGSSGEAPTATMPKAILIEVSSTPGTPRWRRYAAGDMPPTGLFRAANGAGPYATQIAITLQSSWDASLPTALDCISVQ